MEDNRDSYISELHRFVLSDFGKVMKDLLFLFPLHSAIHLLKATVSELLNTGQKRESHEIKTDFHNVMRKEVQQLLSQGNYILDTSIIQEQIRENSGDSLDEGIVLAGMLLDYHNFSKSTIRKIFGSIPDFRREKGFTESFYRNIIESNFNNRNFELPDIACLWEDILEDRVNHVQRRISVKRRNTGIIIIIVVFTFISLFAAALITSRKAIEAGDMSYGTAIKRFFSGIRLPVHRKPVENAPYPHELFDSADDLQAKYPDVYVIDPEYIPDNYKLHNYCLTESPDGEIVSILYEKSKYAWILIKYSIDDYNNEDFFLPYVKYEKVKGNASDYYLFYFDTPQIYTAFFLDEMFVQIEASMDYSGLKKEDVIRMADEISRRYYGTVTD